jgi:hypothetical protein
MKAHGDTVDVLAVGVPQPARLPMLCRVAGTSFAEIERAEGLARGSVSAYLGGRTYLYPRLRRAIVEHLSDRLDVDDKALASYLFEASGERSSPASRPQDRGVKRAPQVGRDRSERQVGDGNG